MAELNFSIMQLIEESQNSGEQFIAPTKDTFSALANSFTYNNTDGSLYEVCVEKQNEYVFFVFSFGNPEPRDENLTDINTGDKTPNPRTTEQAELNNQAFFLFHYDSNRLYASDSRKKGLFGAILKEKMHTDFVVKDIFKNEDPHLTAIEPLNGSSL